MHSKWNINMQVETLKSTWGDPEMSSKSSKTFWTEIIAL